MNLHVAVLVGHCLDVLSTVSTHSGCISGVVSDGNRVDSGTHDAQSLAQVTVADIAFIVWEIQTSGSQAAAQIVQLAYIDGISQRYTGCNIVNYIATKADSVTRDDDVFGAFVDVDAAFVDGHQVFGCIAQSHTIKYRTLSKLNLHVAVLVGHCLDVLSTVSTHSGCISGVVSDGNRVDSGTHDAQSLAQITVADIAFIVWEVQTSSSQAVTQIVQLANINSIS